MGSTHETSVEIERLNVPLKPGFDAAKHSAALTAKINEAKGGGWKLQSIDTSQNKAIYVRRAAVTSVTSSIENPETFEVQLAPADSKTTMGEKVAREQESAYPGFYLTVFDPHLGRARLTKLDDDTVRCRNAVATALGCKAWDVQARPRRDGGFDLELPKAYMPSKHEDKLNEVATSVIGRPGWYTRIDARALTASIIPGELPTFPAIAPLDLQRILKDNDNESIPLGLALGTPGDVEPRPIAMKVGGDPHSILSGTTGSGKSVNIATMITHQLLTGSELVIIDVPHKAIDYFWVKKFVRPGGWGCDSLEGAVTVLSMLYDEGMERAKLLSEHGVQNVRQLPANLRPKTIFIVVDELSGLIQTDPTTGMAKGTPLREKTEYENLLKLTIVGNLKKIAAELRFVGFRMLLASQVMNSTTGVPPSLKTNLTNKMLMGVGATRANRGFALADESRVPQIPEYIKSDEKVGRGVGVVELAGQTPAVLKGFYVSLEDAIAAFDAAGLPTRTNPAPTDAQIAQYTAMMSGDDADVDDDNLGGNRTPSGKPLDPRFGPVETFNEDGKQLFGAAAAAAAAKRSSQDGAAGPAKVTVPSDGPACPACDRPINPVTGECGCD